MKMMAFFGATMVALAPLAEAVDDQILLHLEGTNTVLRIQGGKNDEWRFQSSSDLRSWSNAPALGTVFSLGSDARDMAVASRDASLQFFRAVRTDGLFDVQLLRTISLTFTQANWQTLLANGRMTGSNTLGTLVLDNGITNLGIGARYRGNSSYDMGGTKKSLNIEIDYTNSESRLMGYKTVNLNNAAGDETILREPLYFSVLRQYAPCPRGSLVKLNINGQYWGVYSFVQQENGELIDEWFPSNDGDRWRAPNIGGGAGLGGAAFGGRPGAGGVPGGGGPGGGGGAFGSAASALSYLGANVASYLASYELKTDNSTNAWDRLVHAIDVLNNTPAGQLREKVEEVLAVDRWLWFLAVENVFADDDSYFNKGADYGFYYEPESGRIHPIEHDGNESFIAGDVQLSPVEGAANTNRPVLYRLLSVPELRQRYLAHMRTVLREAFNPTVMNSLIDQQSALSLSAITADTKKNYTMQTYNSDLAALKNFIRQRHTFLTNHAELRPPPPTVVEVNAPGSVPIPGQIPFVTARVLGNDAAGLASVWLFFRDKSYGRFTPVQMLDDGAHGDGAANDGVFGAGTMNFPAGTKVRYYLEARSATSPNAASFAPARAEQETFSYRVGFALAPSTSVLINEWMASNVSTVADPQGDFDDWIELRNITDQVVDLTGKYLSDDANNPRKWPFPDGSRIPASGYLVVWADEDGGDTPTPGLHANFKLSSDGEQIFLVDSDEKLNALLDTVTFGDQETDRSYGRAMRVGTVLEAMSPTPGEPNN